MSTIAVNAITDANAGNTTSINGVTPNSANVIGKNLIINGAMQIAQRGTSESSFTGDTYTTVDRFKTRTGTLGTWTISQSSDVPSGSGFAKSLKFDCTTADASPASGDYLFIEHKMEGQDLQHLKYGTSSAETVTLTFWVKSNKTGTAQVNLRDYDNDKLLGGTYTISSADTWEKKTVTYIGNTSDSIDADNNASLSLEWWLDSGSTWTGGTAPTTWETRAQADRNANNLGLGDSTSNDFQITGVQLEVGESATEFEHRPYGTELQLCQRYYWKNTGNIYGGDWGAYGFISHSYPVEMRAIPTFTYNALRTPLYGSGFGYSTTSHLAVYCSATPYINKVEANAEL